MDRRLYAILIDNRPSVKYRDDEEDEPCTESSQPASDAPGPGGPFSSAADGSDIGNRYPCLACRGQGRIDDPADPPRPVEGYKQVRRIDCPACRGSGKGTKDACRQAYRESVEAYRQEKDEYDRLVRLRREVLQRLTKDEIQALRELGL